MAKRESVVYGRRACLSIAGHRADDLRRVFYEEGAPSRDLAPLLKACAQRRRPYREVSADELVKISGSQHHEGVVAVVTPLPSSSIEDYVTHSFTGGSHQGSALSSGRRPIWIALDRVENDHNHGAIARTLAWFGAEGLIWEGHRAQLSGAALRVAQGGAEQLSLLAVSSLSQALGQLKRRGVLILGADQHAEGSAFTPPTDLDKGAGVCWVMGSEQFGLSKPIKRACDSLVAIPGSDQIESLNVSVSAGLLIAQSYMWLDAE